VLTPGADTLGTIAAWVSRKVEFVKLVERAYTQTNPTFMCSKDVFKGCVQRGIVESLNRFQ